MEPADLSPGLSNGKPASIFHEMFSSKIVCCILLFCLLMCIFHKAIWGTHDFIVRDVGRYYMNYYQLVQEEWQAGRIPLWTPYDNCGTPLLANPCTAVFYPPKLLMFLPCQFADNLKIFILFHYLLTLFNTWRLANFFKLPALACFVVTCCFTFSAPVLYGYTNLPFLCSTALLPLAIQWGFHLIAKPQLQLAIKLAFVLSMMVLCGDPQGAYHTGIILMLATIFNLHKFRVDAQQYSLPQDKSTSQHRLKPLVWLMISALLAVGLSAVQIIPTQEYNQLSTRALSPTPISIWDIPAYFSRTPENRLQHHWYDTIIGNPDPSSVHYQQIYSYSYTPARLLEFFVPGIYGNQYQANKRWTCRFNLESGQVWYPSIGTGVIFYFLIMLALFSDRKDQVIPNSIKIWLLGILLFSLVAAFGKYGLYALYFELSQMLGGIPQDKVLNSGGEIGGLYWLYS